VRFSPTDFILEMLMQGPSGSVVVSSCNVSVIASIWLIGTQVVLPVIPSLTTPHIASCVIGMKADHCDNAAGAVVI
jgi:hypothetical protein